MSKDIEGSVAAVVLVKAESMRTLAEHLSDMLTSAGLDTQAQAMLDVSASLQTVLDALGALPSVNDGVKAMREMFS